MNLQTIVFGGWICLHLAGESYVWALLSGTIHPSRSPFSTPVHRVSSVATSSEDTKTHHQVKGIDCVEVTITLPSIGNVTILEATAAAQETLVDLALLEDGDDVSPDQSLIEGTLATGDPYGAVLWPAAFVVAQRLLAELERRPGEEITMVELGAGTGLVSLAALQAGCQRVVATDYEQIPLDLLQYAAQHLNPSITAEENGIHQRLTCRHLDMLDMENQPLPAHADYVVAADVMYEPKTGRAVAHRVVEALKNNSTIIVGDSPGRAGRPAFLEELNSLLKTESLDFTDTNGWTVTGDRNELICSPESPTVGKRKGDGPQPLTVAILKLDPQSLALPA